MPHMSLEINQRHCYGLLPSEDMPRPPLGSHCCLLLYLPCPSLYRLNPYFKKCTHLGMSYILLHVKPIVSGEVISFVWYIMFC